MVIIMIIILMTNKLYRMIYHSAHMNQVELLRMEESIHLVPVHHYLTKAIMENLILTVIKEHR